MQFQLANPDRIGFIIVAGNTFTYDEPGPNEIDVPALPPDQKNQLLYNCRRGVLACSEPDELVRLCETLMSIAKSYSTPAERPINATTSPLMEAVDPIEEDLKELKTLLEQKISVVKLQAVDLSNGRVRKLLELEISNKNRKGLKTFLNEILTKHTESVMNQVGNEDTGDKYSIATAGQVGSEQVTDIVESELEQVVLNPIEDAEE